MVHIKLLWFIYSYDGYYDLTKVNTVTMVTMVTMVINVSHVTMVTNVTIIWLIDNQIYSAATFQVIWVTVYLVAW